MLFLLSLSMTMIQTPAYQNEIKPSIRGVAIVASAILPGSGQLLTDARKRGEIMVWLDGILWTGWATLSWYRTNLEQDALLIASQYAGANISTKDPRYYRALERYNSSSEYNEIIKKEARELYPDDPDAQRRYFQSHAYYGHWEWKWQSDSIRIFSFWKTRKSARNAGMAASFLISALVLNRIISFIDCIFFSPETHLSRRIDIAPTPSYLGMQFRYHF
ncbi:MAG: hypothetical protein ABIK22_04785 [candidate division WOR-3 bacterium]